VIVSHRPAPVLAADRVIVLEAGLVRASGAHPDLVERDVRYRRAFEASRV
jgi:ATP-binding cassette subfamily B protein